MNNKNLCIKGDSMKVVFSILHYQAIDMTKKCVSSLLQLLDSMCEIVIVDNASPNDSGKDLYQLYKEYHNIHVIINNKNLGFAKGNNVGYQYAKEKLEADVIIVMNNDVIIEQEEFVKEMLVTISKYKVHIIAPHIINLEGLNQNPVRLNGISNIEFLWLIFYNLIMNMILKIPKINTFIVGKLVKRNNSRTKSNNILLNPVENIVPHGAIIVYTSEYIVNENIAFVPSTFLFCEEDILFEYTKIKGYKILYDPNIHAIHYEDVSIKSVNEGELSRRRFIVKHKLDSLRSLAKIKYFRKI